MPKFERLGVSAWPFFWAWVVSGSSRIGRVLFCRQCATHVWLVALPAAERRGRVAWGASPRDPTCAASRAPQGRSHEPCVGNTRTATPPRRGFAERADQAPGARAPGYMTPPLAGLADTGRKARRAATSSLIREEAYFSPSSSNPANASAISPHPRSASYPAAASASISSNRA